MLTLIIFVFCVAVLGVIFWLAIKAIEEAEAEYLADPEGWEERHPERREMF